MGVDDKFTSFSLYEIKSILFLTAQLGGSLPLSLFVSPLLSSLSPSLLSGSATPA